MNITETVNTTIEILIKRKLKPTTRTNARGSFIFYDDVYCVDAVEQIESAVKPFFKALGKTVDVYLQSTTSDDDGAYLTIEYK